MKIELLLFAQLRDAFGAGSVTLEVEAGATVSVAAAAAFASLADQRYEKLPVRFAVGESFVDDDFVLREGDTLALIPPVSGG